MVESEDGSLRSSSAEVPVEMPGLREPCEVKKEAFYLRWLDAFTSPTYAEDDTPEIKHKKKMIYPVAFFFTLLQLLFGILNFFSEQPASALLSLFRAAMAAWLTAQLLITKKVWIRLVEVNLIQVAVTLCFFADFSTRGKYESWTLSLLVMDGLLLAECSRTATTLMAVTTVLYILVKTLEEGFDLGLYAALPSDLRNGDEGEGEGEAKGLAWVLSILSNRECVFLLDFFLTRKFAHGVREEQARAQESATLARRVAEALSRFDLEAAEKLVGTRDDDALRHAFRALLRHLHSYRPYLPTALFNDAFPRSLLPLPDDHPTATGKDRVSNPLLMADFRGCSPGAYRPRLDPPGVGSEMVSVVFTDIQSSTDIWEKHTNAMKEAMELHNAVMRRCIAAANGYEVKTIGDAFMVAFDECVEALNFALESQTELVFAASWPEELLLHPLCRPVAAGDGKLCWKGLRVRIGIHHGAVRLETNPTTSRVDYMGPTVNQAARVESAAPGGAIALTAPVLEVLERHAAELDDPLVIPMGSVPLKGMGRVPLWCCLPRALAQREKHVRHPRDPTHGRRPSNPHAGDRSDGDSAGEPGAPTPCLRLPAPLQLLSSVATVAHLNLRCGQGTAGAPASRVADTLNELLVTVLEGSERHHGLLISATGSSIILSWNAGRQCAAHVVQSVSFVSFLYESAAKYPWLPCLTTGLATGRVLYGSMGSARQRFVSTIGTPIELGRCLSEAAARLNCACLLAGVPNASSDPVTQLHTRPVDKWETRGGAALVVFELNLLTMAQAQSVWGIFDGPVTSEWSEAYKEAFFEGAVDAIEDMSHGDAMLKHVVALMRGKYQLARPLNLELSPL
ncbi:Adenylate cyclase [Diplonema papillatum]|nr:Adenylate cyclase [Diplonema papillatum]